MKNKKMTYVLALVVLIVWGIIIYRVIDASGGTDEPAIPGTVKTVKEPYNDNSLIKDTIRLLLNYRDPFGLKKQPDTAHFMVKKRYKLAILTPAINWSFIRYSGYIRNPGSKKIIALLSINGHNVMLGEGETVDRVKLLKNMRDSVKINFNGKTKFIPMNPRTL